MGARKKQPSCNECGAVLREGADRCPLCGAESNKGSDSSSPVDVESYQSDVRVLRDELKRLRQEGAEAV